MTVRVCARRLWWLGLAILSLALVACLGGKGRLKPEASIEDGGQMINGRPLLLSFPELQDDPDAYQDVLIRVTGSFQRLPTPDCTPNSGPGASWALIAEGLRLDAQGFGDLLTSMVPQGTTMTVDGVFRLYEGPLGCGKEPPPGRTWYLETLQVVQPNPITRRDDGAPAAGEILLNLPPSQATPALPAVGATPTATDAGGYPPPIGTGIPTATPTTALGSTLTPSPTGTLSTTNVPTASATPGATSAGGTSTATGTATATSLPGTPTPSLTPSQTPPSVPTQPPLPTATTGGGGYPGGTTTPGYP